MKKISFFILSISLMSSCSIIKNKKIDNSRIYTIEKQNETLVQKNNLDKSNLLISCHGAVSHVATAKNIRQIDIIDESKTNFYKNWTDHFRNYSFVYRKNFNDLSKEIISLL